MHEIYILVSLNLNLESQHFYAI